ncbi:MAG: Ig-like domain-containing protein [bacterium]
MKGRVCHLWALFGILAVSILFSFSVLLTGQPGIARGQAETGAEDDYLESSGAEEGNDTFSQATVLGPGLYEGLRCLDVDWYKITIPEEQALRITLMFSDSNNGNLDLVLYRGENDPSWKPGYGNWVASSFSQTDNEEILIQAQAGTYYCQVFSSTPDADNQYALKIEGFLYTPTVYFYQWIDVPPAAAPLFFLNSDDSFEEVDIGFPFFFFGEEVTSLLVSSNGYLTFGENCATEAENNALQTMVQPLIVIAPFWDDLNPEAGGEVYAWLDEESSPRRFIIQWNEMCSYYAAQGTAITFEVILSEGSNAITFQYKDLLFRSPQDGYSYGQSATVGLKYSRSNQLLSRLYSYNGQRANAYLADGLAISFAPSKIQPSPFVISYVPDSRDPDSLSFPRDRAIAINFSKPMNPDLTSSALAIQPPVHGQVRWLNNNQTLWFHPDEYWAGAQAYTVSVSQTAQDLDGLVLATAFQFTFITDENLPPPPVEVDTLPPQVTLYLDSNRTDAVPVSAKVYLAFTEPMVPQSVEKALSFSRTGGGEVAYTLTAQDQDHTLWTISPGQNLAYDSAYTVEVRPSALDEAGNALGTPVSLSFRTQKPPGSGPGDSLSWNTGTWGAGTWSTGTWNAGSWNFTSNWQGGWSGGSSLFSSSSSFIMPSMPSTSPFTTTGSWSGNYQFTGTGLSGVTSPAWNLPDNTALFSGLDLTTSNSWSSPSFFSPFAGSFNAAGAAFSGSGGASFPDRSFTLGGSLMYPAGNIFYDTLSYGRTSSLFFPNIFQQY